MVYVDLPPEVDGPAVPVAAGRALMEPRRAWRRERVLQQLADPVVIGETAGLLDQQVADIRSAFAPRNGWQDWLTSTIATIMLRINRSERVERKLRDWASYRAFDFWEEDQRLAVEAVALKLARQPARVVAQLRATPGGIDWLLARWRALARVAPPAWTADQRDLAARLGGVDPTAADVGIDAANAGIDADAVAARIAELEGLRAQVERADAIVRGLVEADLHDDGVPGLARLRRYVRSLQRQLKWYVDQFHVEHPDRWDDPRRRAASDGPPREEWRPRNPDHFEGRAEADPPPPQDSAAKPTPAPAPTIPRIDETKPTPTPAVPRIDETKPTPAPTTPRIDETKPSRRPGPAIAAASRPAIDPPPFVRDYSNEAGRHHGRSPRPGEPGREYARRLRLARRRTNLALAELT